MPRVSVVLPFYNAESTLVETLGSLLSQTEKNFELVFVDDCSSDGSAAIVKEWTPKFDFTRLVSLKVNVGPGLARNYGIDRCSSDIVAFIDADDIWYPDKLKVQLAVHTETNCDISCTAFKFGNKNMYQGRTDYDALLKNNIVNTSTVMFDKTRLQFKFQNTYKSEDYIAWLAIAKKTKIQFVNVLLAERRSIDGLSSNKLAMAMKRWRIYRDVEGLGLIRSMYYFFHYVVSGLKKYPNFQLNIRR